MNSVPPKKPSDLNSIPGETAVERAMREAAGGGVLGRAIADAQDTASQRAIRDALGGSLARITSPGMDTASQQFYKEIDEAVARQTAVDPFVRGIARAFDYSSEADTIKNAVARLTAPVNSDIFKRLGDQLSISTIGDLKGVGERLSSIMTATQWADRLSLPRIYEDTIGRSVAEALRTSLTGLSAGAAALKDNPLLRQPDYAGLALTGLPSIPNPLHATSLKLSVFAGSSELLGYRSAVSEAAFRSVLGTWATRANLREDFWTDPQIRQSYYRDAEVDEALIDASPTMALTVLIDSGVMAGGGDGQGSVIGLIGFGGVTTTIRGGDTRLGAFRMLDAFEERMRTFITERLSAVQEGDWFKRRAPQQAVKLAKEKRAAAVTNGEQSASLINYTDLGQLIDIVVSGQNWESVFGAIFVNRDEFRVDMSRLVASRRPTAHVREIDGVRLVEIALITDRLNGRMDRWDDPAPELHVDGDD